MKIGFQILLIALSSLAVSHSLMAQSAAGVLGPESDNEVQTTRMREKRRSEITHLICADANAHGSTKKIDPTAPAYEPPQENIGEHLVVDDAKPLIFTPMIVTGRKPPFLLMPKESYFERYFRTGRLAQHVGKDVTTSFGFTPSKGLFLSLDF